MEIQTLSLVVPAGCPNRCRFCVSRLHTDEGYVNQIEQNRRYKHLYRDDFIKRMSFARDNGCNTMIYTGDGEPVLNLHFLEDVSEWNNQLAQPFRWIELQTSGVTLDEDKLRWLRDTVEVSTISLSLSSVWDSAQNADYNQTPEDLAVDIDRLCGSIKRHDFNLRLSLNMTDYYNASRPEDIFERVRMLGADQVTFRVLYDHPSPETAEQISINEWIRTHRCRQEIIQSISETVKTRGHEMELLPFGARRYDMDGISTVIDDDCMNTESRSALKYLILRPNCKLYTKWDHKGSLLF